MSGWNVGDVVAVRWMDETVTAKIERIDLNYSRRARAYWLTIPGVEHLAAYGERELALPDPYWCKRP